MNKPNLIDAFLEEQSTLQTAVTEFSSQHDSAPSQAKYYQKLLPLEMPGEGEQYAFEVDLDKCSGCKGCVTACHNLNGLSEEETWRDVGSIHGGTWENPFVQTVTTACHHCVEPGCMEGCPTLAYDKDPTTGIVKHLDDQCIGCQYCTFKCPYEVPKYNKSMGIVRKCDMCSNRLEVGEAPACVQGCPTEAISIKIVKQADLLERAEEGVFLPGAPDPSYTKPTTTYKRKESIPENAEAADKFSMNPEHAHMPLVIMTILTQVSVGVFSMDWIAGVLGLNPNALTPYKALAALILGIVALNAAILHLGRPLYAWRAIIGLKTSWMSREILAFGAFAGAAKAYALVLWLPNLREYLPLELIPIFIDKDLPLPLGAAVVITGLGGVFSSGMIYVDTKRIFWNFSRSMGKFFGTALVMGISGLILATVVFEFYLNGSESLINLTKNHLNWAWVALPIAVSAKLIFEQRVMLHLKGGNDYLHRTALLLTGPLKRPYWFRMATGIGGGIVLPIVLLFVQFYASVNFTGWFIFSFTVISFLILLVGEFLERILFFSAVVSPKMPGGFQ